nr:hypothetical protein [Tanacetum cinerariifolium]
MCLYIDAEEQELGDLGEPANYKAALLDPESKKWLNAMNVEMQSMKDNKVRVLVELPPNGKTVGSKWLFKKKTDIDGNAHTYKARLVAKGYTQTSGIDYEETFSPVADIRAIRILIAIATYYNYEIWQMDVKTAFLNGYLNEEVYMEQPEGFVNLKYPNRVCKLKRSIYGLKQASRCFAMKDLGKATYILGIKIYRDRSRRLIGLCQSAYIEKILKRFCMENSKRRSIPMQEKLKLSKSQGASMPAELKHMQNVPYASAVGFIMYAVRCTRPDVAFAQNVTSRFQQNPGDIHCTTVKNIMKYLRNTKHMFLVYGGDLKRELRVSCYTDAGYLTDADDLKSQTGYVFILNGGAVDWKNAKQSILLLHLQKLSILLLLMFPKKLYGLGNSFLGWSGITKGARHFRAKVHYLREVIEYGDIKLEKVHTYDNLADPFTKALAFPKLSEHTRNIGMLPASSLISKGKKKSGDGANQRDHYALLGLGDEDSSIQEVDAFYDFWYSFKSWREFPHEDEFDLEEAESRDHKRWMESQNAKLSEKSRKEEYTRIRSLVDNAYRREPRVVKRKKMLKAEKQKKKESKYMAKKLQEEEAARIADEERIKKEEEEKQAAEATALQEK